MSRLTKKRNGDVIIPYYSQTIANLKWLEEQDLPSEIWEMIIPKVDELNMTIDKFKFMILESEIKEND